MLILLEYFTLFISLIILKYEPERKDRYKTNKQSIFALTKLIDSIKLITIIHQITYSKLLYNYSKLGNYVLFITSTIPNNDSNVI